MRDEMNIVETPARMVARESVGFMRFLLNELKPKGKIFTPFNVITAPLILLGLVLIVIRFAKGLGAVTNLDQNYPWGIWIGFDVVTGVAFAGGAYVITFIVYVLGVKKYEPIVRAYLLRYPQHNGSVEDIIQEVFARLLKIAKSIEMREESR